MTVYRVDVKITDTSYNGPNSVPYVTHYSYFVQAYEPEDALKVARTKRDKGCSFEVLKVERMPGKCYTVRGREEWAPIGGDEERCTDERSTKR